MVRPEPVEVERQRLRALLATRTPAERRVIRLAARQSVRWDGWFKAQRHAGHALRRQHYGRRAIDRFHMTHKAPKKPQRPLDMPWAVWAAGPLREWERERATYRMLEKQAVRGTKRPHGERRGQPFPEKTGAQVLEEFTRHDEIYWVQLASDAIALAKDDAFRSQCGRPRTMSEIWQAREAA
jgi:hypothetical protein